MDLGETGVLHVNSCDGCDYIVVVLFKSVHALLEGGFVTDSMLDAGHLDGAVDVPVRDVQCLEAIFSRSLKRKTCDI